MKTTIEINGYEVVIEETEGVLKVKAQKNDETIEEFEIDTTEEDGEDEVKEVEDDDLEDGDFEDDDFENTDDEEEETKLESFNSFIKKRK